MFRRALAVVAVAAVMPPLAGASIDRAAADGLYVAIGPSTTAGWGAGLARRGYVELHFGYLRSTGAVTEFRNLGAAGATTTQLRVQQLPSAVAFIDRASDTKLVTIDICCNDQRDRQCSGMAFGDPRCPIAENLRTILDTLTAALARDAGDETIKVIESPLQAGTATAAVINRLLLGADGRIGCDATGDDVGMNDLARCIAVEKGAVPVVVPPLGPDHLANDEFGHPNAAGHRVIAEALGGALEIIPAASPPVVRECLVPNVVGKALRNARRMIAAAGCRTGRVRRVASSARKDVVLRQTPRAGRRLPRLGIVSLVVSTGRR